MTKASPRRLSAARIFGRVLVILASLALAALMALHTQIPDVFGLGLIVDNVAPWLGIAVICVIIMGLALGGKATITALLVPTVTWAVMFGPAFIPHAKPDAEAPLSIATQNVHLQAVDSALTLADTDADVITLQELGEGQIDQVTSALADTHPYHFSVSTVGIWSKYPLENETPLDLGLGWDRALRVDVTTQSSTVRIYAVHAASARPFQHKERDTMLASLNEYLAADPSTRIVATGDFNATSTDRHFAPLRQQLDELHSSGWGLNFSWPTRPLPMLGIDHVLLRGFESGELRRLHAGDSDHYALREIHSS